MRRLGPEGGGGTGKVVSRERMSRGRPWDVYVHACWVLGRVAWVEEGEEEEEEGSFIVSQVST